MNKLGQKHGPQRGNRARPVRFANFVLVEAGKRAMAPAALTRPRTGPADHTNCASDGAQPDEGQ